MGLSVAFGGGIILVALFYVMATATTLLGTNYTVSSAASEISAIESSISKTDFSIVIDGGSSGTDVEFDITNTGTTKLWNYEKFDVIITYDTSSGKVTDKLSYVESCPPAATKWCFNQFTNDNLEPKILNPDETFEINATLTSSIGGPDVVVVVVSTDNGVVATKSKDVS